MGDGEVQGARLRGYRDLVAGPSRAIGVNEVGTTGSVEVCRSLGQV